MAAPLIYFVGIFRYFAKRFFKKEYSVTKSMFFPKKKTFTKKPKEIAKSCHNFLKYESVLKIFNFHILNITKLV
jgi:hypothetical protein